MGGSHIKIAIGRCVWNFEGMDYGEGGGLELVWAQGSSLIVLMDCAWCMGSHWGQPHARKPPLPTPVIISSVACGSGEEGSKSVWGEAYSSSFPVFMLRHSVQLPPCHYGGFMWPVVPPRLGHSFIRAMNDSNLSVSFTVEIKKMDYCLMRK